VLRRSSSEAISWIGTISSQSRRIDIIKEAPRTLSKLLQASTRMLCRPMGNIDRFNEAWNMSFRVRQGAQGRDAKLVGAAEQDL
jgi:hypothetical protein